MKRWRRPLLVVALLLLAGAVVNVAVAWVFVGAPDSWTPEFKGAVIAHGEAEQLERLTTRLWGRRRERTADEGAIVRGLGWTVHSGVRYDGRSRHWSVRRLDCGWPFRSMTLAATQGRPDEPVQYTASLEPSRRQLPGPAWFRADYRDRLPLTPIPRGFAINTLFYAAILALPLSFFPIRRRLRARRGRCPKCGYDLAGLANPAAPCPECGAAR
jgi:hypothetical protein